MVQLKLELPSHFLDEEVRNDYRVSSKMKEIWSVELDLLAEFMRVCKKHDIHFWVDSGTLLGAVRHQGMIPWDDDIDVVIMRDEYKKLCKVAPSEFSNPYFFQTEDTDPGSLRGHAQLRNSETTGILQSELSSKLPFNQGIFIDIFPLDSVPNTEKEQKIFLTKIMNQGKKMAKITKRYRYDQRWWKRCIYRFYRIAYRFLGISYKPLYDALDKIFQTYDNNDACKYLQDLTTASMDNFHPFLKEWFKDTIYFPFEMLTVPVPKEYDKILKVYYGDWHKMVRGGSVHGGVIFDTDKSYKTYLR